jgi:GTP-binding protein
MEKTLSAQFVGGVTGTSPVLFEPRPHIAFVGRSNVGKSSTINTLIGSRVAHSSNTPGKTTELNCYLVSQKYLFVDTPGYGFARLPAPQREKIRKMILWYLFQSEIKHKAAVLIIDAKVGPMPLDEELLTMLSEKNAKVVVLANKADQIPRSKRAAREKELEKMLKTKVILFSTKDKMGRSDALAALGL